MPQSMVICRCLSPSAEKNNMPVGTVLCIAIGEILIIFREKKNK